MPWKVLQIHVQLRMLSQQNPQVRTATCMSYIGIISILVTYTDFKSVSELVEHYKQKQAQDRKPKSKPTAARRESSAKEPTKYYSVRQLDSCFLSSD